MLVHFIGGPIHGRSEAIPNPQSIYRVPELKGRLGSAWSEETLPPLAVDWTEHQYRIIKRTPRYAIAEWEAPLVDVRFSVRLELDPFDHEAIDAFRRFFMERRTEEKHGVRCIGASTASGIESELELVSRVEGPADATALELAAKQVQHYLDAELPPCKQFISAVEASTS